MNAERPNRSSVRAAPGKIAPVLRSLRIGFPPSYAAVLKHFLQQPQLVLREWLLVKLIDQPKTTLANLILG